MKKTILFTFYLFSTAITFSQSPNVLWRKDYGGNYFESATDIVQTHDNGFILVGYTLSYNGDVVGQHSNGTTTDIWVLKLNEVGDIQWQKCLGGTDDERASSVIETNNNEYLIVGYNESDDGDVNGHHGSSGPADGWIVKLDSLGNILWEKSFGNNSSEEYIYRIQEVDGGYVTIGSYEGILYDSFGNSCDGYWIMKIDYSGNTIWTRCYGESPGFFFPKSISVTDDNGFIVSGSMMDFNGPTHYGLLDFWILKLDSVGNLQWEKYLGGSQNDYAFFAEQSPDHGYIIAGYTKSNDSLVSGNHGDADMWIIKLDTLGTLQWQKCIGGSEYDDAEIIHTTSDNGFIIGGESISSDGDILYNPDASVANAQPVIIKIDSAGNILWFKTLEGPIDEANTVIETFDGNYVAAGGSNLWVAKLANTASIQENMFNAKMLLYPNPTHSNVIVELSLSKSSQIKIVLQDIYGSILKIFKDYSVAGLFRKNIDLPYCAGIYFISFITEEGTVTKKLEVLK